ncbi:MAG: undecaprenyl-phosphate glucose phosphotransferase [Proteobacteria bacterium]|nr:MAG: undecaprenyl-phosphate glucose phosphotransferase [Pseudomonadota bacterium]
MLKRYYQVFGSFLIVSDASGLIASWVIAYYLRFYTQIVPVTKGIPPFSRYVSLTVPVVFLWLAVFSYFKLYKSSEITRRTTEVVRVIKAQITATMLFVVLTWVFTEYRFSRVVIGYFAAFSGVYAARGNKARQVVIVGAGGSARAVVERMLRMPELGIQVKGFYTKDGLEDSTLPFPVLGKYADVKNEAGRTSHEIVVALPRKDAAAQDEILQSLNDTVTEVRLVPDVYDYLTLGCTVEDFDQIPVLALNETAIDPLGAFFKRLMDLVGSATALLIFSPIYLATAIAIKLTSRGPIFYGQERMSVDGSTFRMWKFRSMKVNAEEATGAVWAVPNDERRTPIGSFLRKTSLDEIPQFWNVFVGEMSLVGPRPERPEFVHQFRGNIPKYMLRHKVKAGITGWAQVNGWRGDTSLEKRIECDLYYIRHWSLPLDCKILALTFLKGFIHKNAY